VISSPLDHLIFVFTESRNTAIFDSSANISQEESEMPIEKIGVVGCGLMGSGIAQVAAQAG
jgi:hypothetical protein